VLALAAAEEVKTASTNGAPQKATSAAVDFDELTELIKWDSLPESCRDALSWSIAAGWGLGTCQFAVVLPSARQCRFARHWR
jgi:hypothetical protein